MEKIIYHGVSHLWNCEHARERCGHHVGLALFAFSLFMVALVMPAFAQTRSDQPVKIVVSLAPGGATDVGTRILAKAYTSLTSQQVVVENRPGGGGTIAAMAVKQSPPDGHTLLVLDNGGCCINAMLNNVGYDGTKDFKPVLMLWGYPHFLVVAADSSIKSIADLVTAAKGGTLTYGSQGVATGGHILGELFSRAANIPLIHVPFRGAAPAAMEVSTGRVDMLFASYASVKPFIDNGQLRSIASTAEPGRRMVVSDFSLPSMADEGYSTVVFDAWFMLLAPAETPTALVKKLHADFGRALRSIEVANVLNKLQMIVPEDTSPAAVRSRMKNEISAISPIIESLRRN